jgi:hypothetical protein
MKEKECYIKVQVFFEHYVLPFHQIFHDFLGTFLQHQHLLDLLHLVLEKKIMNNNTDKKYIYQQVKKQQKVKSFQYFVQDSIVQRLFHNPTIIHHSNEYLYYFLTIGSSPGACKIEIHTLPSG